MTDIITSGRRMARKTHRCFECCGSIDRGVVYGYQTNTCDGRIYTIRYHVDCDELAKEYFKICGYTFDDGERAGLREEWCTNGEYHSECDLWRGYYPHVIARMELSDQLRDHKPVQKEGE